MSEGPYRNMSYKDAARAMRRIYELLYPRKFHSYNPSLDEPFANFVGTRNEKDPIPNEFTKLYGEIGNVVDKYAPILGDISYIEGEAVESIPAGQSKVILDWHGMAILNSLLEVAELGARYITTINSQINTIKNGAVGQTPAAIGNRLALTYTQLITSVDSVFTNMYGSDTLTRVKDMITRLSAGSHSGVTAKNVNVVRSIENYQVGQEEVISDAFDKDFLEYFMMYLEAENYLHDHVKADYDKTTEELRKSEIENYNANKGKPGNSLYGLVINSKYTSSASTASAKFARYVDVSGCRSSCVGLCVASCSNTCFGCSDQCSGQCTATCADCTNGCMDKCTTTCQGTCNVDCIGCTAGCAGGCISECKNECGGTCQNGCHEDCVGSCYGTAEGYADKCAECGSECKGTCGNSCESTSSAADPGPDPMPSDIEIVPDDMDPPVNPDPPVVNPQTPPSTPTIPSYTPSITHPSTT